MSVASTPAPEVRPPQPTRNGGERREEVRSDPERFRESLRKQARPREQMPQDGALAPAQDSPVQVSLAPAAEPWTPRASAKPLAIDEAAICLPAARAETSLAPLVVAGAAAGTVAGDAALQTAFLDRVTLPQATSSETALSLPGSRWTAEGATIVRSVEGELTLSIDLRQDQRGHNHAADELRRRLEARGIVVARIDL